MRWASQRAISTATSLAANVDSGGVVLGPDTTGLSHPFVHRSLNSETSVRITLQRLRYAIRQRCPRRVQHDRQKIVIADDPEQIDDALLAEFGNRAGVGRVADALEPQDLGRHVVGDLLVFG